MSNRLALLEQLASLMLRGNPDDHVNTLGIDIVDVKIGKAVMKLDYHNALIASPETIEISGGAITALLDMCSGLCATTVLEPIGLTPTIDLRIDYLRKPVPKKTIYAEVEVVRNTQHIIFTRGIAWQDNKNEPIVQSMGNFMNMPFKNDFEKVLSQSHKNIPIINKSTQQAIETVSPQVSLEVLNSARENNDANILIEFIPYTRLLNMQRIKALDTDKWLYFMPPSKKLIGNPTLPAIHGGALAGFMESAAILDLLMKMTGTKLPKVLDFHIDYIRAGLLKATYAKCHIVRYGNKLVFMEVSAWQDDPEKHIAKARLQVLVG